MFGGSRFRSIHAAYQFFLYTFFGSVLMLVGLVFIYLSLGTTDMNLLSKINFSFNRETFIFFVFFFSFAMKVPMFPVHVWLPEAHVEAPTSGSVLLAGILLKLGGYGFYSFLMPLFPNAFYYYVPFIFLICLLSIIYSSFTALRQMDLKKMMAYSSVAHMNLSVLGLFSFNLEGIEGSIFLMLSHALVSSGLFLVVGVLYDRFSTRIISYYGGLIIFMPFCSFVFFLFILGNMGFPGTSSFIGEFLIFIGICSVNFFLFFLSSISIILSSCYSVWLYSRLFYGNLFYLNFKLKLLSFNFVSDFGSSEFYLFFPLVIFIFLLGFFPNLFLGFLYLPCSLLCFFEFWYEILF